MDLKVNETTNNCLIRKCNIVLKVSSKMRKKISEKKQYNILIITTISIMLPITLNAFIREDCKDRLMDLFTNVCGNDRFKRGIEKFDLKKDDYKKLALTEFIDLSLEEQNKPIFIVKHEKTNILSKLTNSKEDNFIADIVSNSNQEKPILRHRRHFPKKSLTSVLIHPQYDIMKNNDLNNEMNVEDLYEFYNDLNDRVPRSFSQDEWKEILREFVKTCCYGNNTCDSRNTEILCF